MLGMRSQNVISKELHMSKAVTVLAKQVNSRIVFIRERKVILDNELAHLYGVEVRHLNRDLMVPAAPTRRQSAFSCPQASRRQMAERCGLRGMPELEVATCDL